MAETPGMIFARRLREERLAAGVPQTELGRRISERLGSTVDGSAITRMEKGERGVRIDEAVAIADVLELPLAVLVSGADLAEEKIAELQREHERLQSRAHALDTELREVQVAMDDVQRQIDQLGATQQ